MNVLLWRTTQCKIQASQTDLGRTGVANGANLAANTLKPAPHVCKRVSTWKWEEGGRRVVLLHNESRLLGRGLEGGVLAGT